MARPGELPEANLDGAALCDARLEGPRFVRDGLRGCDLRDAVMAMCNYATRRTTSRRSARERSIRPLLAWSRPMRS